MKRLNKLILLSGAALACVSLPAVNAATNIVEQAVILTPPSPPTPRINGAGVFGVRPGAPFLYTIPATGDRPISTGAPASRSDTTLWGASSR